MELKYAVSAGLAVSGGVLALKGFLSVNPGYINLGIAGMFLSAVLLVLKSSKYVKREAVDVVLKSQMELFDALLKNLKLEGNALYLPPYENLPKGGIFVPLHENFELDPARFDEETLFVTDVPNDRAMGLLLSSIGEELVEKYEEHLEGPITTVPELESASSSVLRTLGLAKRVYIEEKGDRIRIVVNPEFLCDPRHCEKMPCPVCASVLRGLAKATGEVIETERFEKKDYGIEIEAKKLGRVEEWM